MMQWLWAQRTSRPSQWCVYSVLQRVPGLAPSAGGAAPQSHSPLDTRLRGVRRGRKTLQPRSAVRPPLRCGRQSHSVRFCLQKTATNPGPQFARLNKRAATQITGVSNMVALTRQLDPDSFCGFLHGKRYCGMVTAVRLLNGHLGGLAALPVPNITSRRRVKHM